LAKYKIALILRGRPGLAHVVPLYIIGDLLAKQGHEILFLSYSQGVKFIKNSGNHNVIDLKLNNNYSNWPGLEIYPHAIKKILPELEKFKPDMVLFGGEYFIIPILQLIDTKSGVMFSHKTFLKSTHNKWFKKMLYNHFNQTNCVLSIDKIPSKIKQNLHNEIIEGPFKYINNNKSKNEIYLIANGGGCELPQSTSSYTKEKIKSSTWEKQTYEYTKIAINQIVKFKQNNEKIHVFSGLNESLNLKLKNKFDDKNIIFHDISIKYHEFLPLAKLFISRAGAATVTDAYGLKSNTKVILWSLKEHNEQNIQKKQSNITYVTSEMSLKQTIEDYFVKENKVENKKMNTSNYKNIFNDTQQAVKKIITIIEDSKNEK
jgi:UDP-N-acetylglucosamine:LPS N-acetylglucosamine transferase